MSELRNSSKLLRFLLCLVDSRPSGKGLHAYTQCAPSLCQVPLDTLLDGYHKGPDFFYCPHLQVFNVSYWAQHFCIHCLPVGRLAGTGLDLCSGPGGAPPRSPHHTSATEEVLAMAGSAEFCRVTVGN